MLAVVDIEKSTIELFAEKGGKVTKLFVKEGDSVKPKDAFVEIDDTAVDVSAASTPEVPKETPKASAKAETPQPKAEAVKQPVKAAPSPVKAAPAASASAAPQKNVPNMIVTDFVATTERTE